MYYSSDATAPLMNSSTPTGASAWAASLAASAGSPLPRGGVTGVDGGGVGGGTAAVALLRFSWSQFHYRKKCV